MNHRATTLLLLAALLSVPAARGESAEAKIAALRAGFAEVGLREIARSQVPRDQRRQLPSAYEACLPLLKAPPEILTESLDRGIRQGELNERIGALEVYGLAISPTEHKIPKRPEYQTVFVDLLKRDDQLSPAYTGVLMGALYDYRSVQTVHAYLDVLPRTTNPELREGLIEKAAGLLHLEIPIYQQTTPLQKERILSDLEVWLNRNKDRIRSKKDGQPYVAGGEADGIPLELSGEDRKRIRKDPVCVLQLMASMTQGREDTVELSQRCGEALLGSDGARLFKAAQETAATQGSPTLDVQAVMASARRKYPTMDAVLLAIAYVAAYETDPRSRELARDTLEELGSPDMNRILKGEPREVREKAKELADDVGKEGGEK